MSRSYSQAAAFVLESIRSLGISFSMQSRLAQMATLLMEHEYIPRDDVRFEHALEAVRDITLMEFVFDHAADGVQHDVKFIEQIKKAIDDSILPQDDRQQSRGRNTQFELYIYALCRSAGLHPVSFGEPDVLCRVRNVDFGIAAKRIKSLSKLKARIAGAADQIGRSNLPGIIALDTCLVLNPKNQRVTFRMTDDEFGTLWIQALARFVSDYHAWIQEEIRGKGVRGIIIHDHQVRWRDEAKWELCGMAYSVDTTRGNKRRAKEAKSFFDLYVKGLPRLMPRVSGNPLYRALHN